VETINFLDMQCLPFFTSSPADQNTHFVSKHLHFTLFRLSNTALAHNAMNCL